MPFSPAEIQAIGDAHITDYNRTEKPQVDAARRFYVGQAFPEGKTFNTKDGAKYATSKNLAYAIIDTAITSLVGNNPEINAKGENPDSVSLAPVVAGRINKVFRKNDIRTQLALSLIDAGQTGRSVFKTIWNAALGMAEISVVDPVGVFFDQSARVQKDITYWLHIAPVREHEWRRRLGLAADGELLPGLTEAGDIIDEDGQALSEEEAASATPSGGEYKRYLTKAALADPAVERNLFDAMDARPDGYPAILQGQDRQGVGLGANSSLPIRWFVVWEFFDCTEGIVYHYHPATRTVLLCESYKDKYPNPFTLYFLNHNGKDCKGLSELQLILDQLETINDLLTLLKEITYKELPKTGYDKSTLGDEKTLAESQEASVGDFIGFALNADASGQRKMEDLFFKIPVPEHPEDVHKMIALMEEIATYVSALADAARGQITNARTATEVAVLDAQMQTRLLSRRSFLYAALEDIAMKVFELDRRFLRATDWVRTAGSSAFAQYDLDSIAELDLEFQMIAWNPMRTNPAVILESLQNLLGWLQTSPAVDQDRLAQFIVRGLGAPEEVLVPEAELAKVRKMQKLAIAQQAQAAEEAAKSGKPLLGGPPPDEAAETPPDALAALGPAAALAGQTGPVEAGVANAGMPGAVSQPQGA